MLKTIPDPNTQTPDMAKSKSTGLLDLPRELRDAIYRRAFTNRTVTIDLNYRLPGILLACTQTHDEAIKAYYKYTIIEFHRPQTAYKWLRALPATHFAMLKHVRYDTAYKLGMKTNRLGNHWMYLECAVQFLLDEFAERLKQESNITLPAGVLLASVKDSLIGAKGAKIWVERACESIRCVHEGKPGAANTVASFDLRTRWEA